MGASVPGKRGLMPANPSYEESKQVAEDSREAGWEQPSFGRELFLGKSGSARWA